MPIINDKARVYQFWVNGNERLYYKGATAQLNAALAKFAKVKVKNHVVVLRSETVERRSIIDKSLIPFNWELHVIGGLALIKATDDCEDLEWQKDPVLTVYIGGDIDLDKIEIPKDVTLRAAPNKGQGAKMPHGVTLRAAPGESQTAKTIEAARKKIEEFVEQQKSKTKKQKNKTKTKTTKIKK